MNHQTLNKMTERHVFVASTMDGLHEITLYTALNNPTMRGFYEAVKDGSLSFFDEDGNESTVNTSVVVKHTIVDISVGGLGNAA